MTPQEKLNLSEALLEHYQKIDCPKGQVPSPLAKETQLSTTYGGRPDWIIWTGSDEAFEEFCKAIQDEM